MASSPWPEPGTAAPAAAPRALRVGGLTPFTSIDYPGQLAAVVFVQGCPWRCVYCHNPHLQRRGGDGEATGEGSGMGRSWPSVRGWLARRAGLIDAVVFSGGEPTIDPRLGEAMDDVRALGFRIGLHTAGIYPRRLQALLPRVDWIGFDVKAPLSDAALHDGIAGVAGSTRGVESALRLVLGSGVALECRTTAHPSLLPDPVLLRLARELAALGVRRYALQLARAVPSAPGGIGAAPAGYPAAATLTALRGLFTDFTLRAGT